MVRSHFEEREQLPFISGTTPIQLSAPSFGDDEVCEAVDSLLSTHVTMGSKVRRFEDACEAHGAEWHGKKLGSFGCRDYSC
jgi:dTDP-4-amino-4,6-dideoxygalactose transaminase